MQPCSLINSFDLFFCFRSFVNLIGNTGPGLCVFLCPKLFRLDLCRMGLYITVAAGRSFLSHIFLLFIFEAVFCLFIEITRKHRIVSIVNRKQFSFA